jgi:hypothetical protein
LILSLVTLALCVRAVMASVRRGTIARGVVLARTADRSVLGRMNDMAFLCEHAIAEAGASRAPNSPQMSVVFDSTLVDDVGRIDVVFNVASVLQASPSRRVTAG